MDKTMGLVNRIIKTQIRRVNTSNSTRFADDKLHVVLIGTGGPFNRKNRVFTCTAIITGKQMIFFDIGPGTWRNADIQGLPLSRLSAIFLTHFHSDHIGNLGEANFGSWTQGRVEPLEIYGGDGVEEVVQGFSQAYNQDTKYRVAHHGEGALSHKSAQLKAIKLPKLAPNESTLVFNKDGLEIFAFPVDHTPVHPAIGYRIEYRGKSVVISGDTIKTPNLSKFAHNADIFICDALSHQLMEWVADTLVQNKQNRLAKLMSDIHTYHMSPHQAGEVAIEAKVSLLVLTHLVPPVPRIFLRFFFLKPAKQAFKGKTILGKDGMHFMLKGK